MGKEIAEEACVASKKVGKIWPPLVESITLFTLSILTSQRENITPHTPFLSEPGKGTTSPVRVEASLLSPLARDILLVFHLDVHNQTLKLSR